MSRSNDLDRSILRRSIAGLQATLVDGGGRFARLATAVERELWLLAIGLMLVDVTLTVHGLDVGLVERNPVARAALDVAGVLGLYALKGAVLAVAGVGWSFLADPHRIVVPLALVVPNAIAVVVNATLIGYVVI